MVDRRSFIRTAISAAATGFVAACQRRLIKPPECAHYDEVATLAVVDVHSTNISRFTLLEKLKYLSALQRWLSITQGL